MKPVNDRNISRAKRSLSTWQCVVFASMFLGYTCYTYSRKSVAFAMPTLLQFQITTSNAGLITSNQNLAYAVSKFIGGVLSDKLSSRTLFSVGLFLSALTTVAFALSDSVFWFSTFWFLNGISQGPGWPSCVKLLRQWYPQSRFGTVWSALSASINLAGILGPPVAVYIILHHGWRQSLITAGIICAFVSAVCYFTLTDSPKDVGFSSFLRKEDPDKNANSKRKSSKGNWRDLLSNNVLWVASVSYLVVSCAKTAFSDWSQVYLIEEKKMNPYKASSFVSAMESGGLVGGIFTGYVTDWILSTFKHKGGKSNPRLPVATVFTVLLSTAIHFFCNKLDTNTSESIILALGFVIGTSLYGPINIYGMVAIESAPSHLSGTAHSIVALAANFGAMSAGLPLASIAVNYGWTNAFWLLNILSISTVLFHVTFMFLINPEKTLKSKRRK